MVTMTVQQARAALSRMLIFGDPEQIAAADLIQRYEEVSAMPLRCPDCEGRGETECSCKFCEGHPCGYCGGDGKIAGKKLLREGMIRLEIEAIASEWKIEEAR